ncbi:hypothetical protein HMPREF1141_2235 [Clostridium sp. MSTE9]|nr:hypothetical protein HMPREF1141_2235 [Clostridium sp. MSTE9]
MTGKVILQKTKKEKCGIDIYSALFLLSGIGFQIFRSA